MFSINVALLLVLLLAIEVKTQNSWFFNSFQQNRFTIRGNLLSNDQLILPFGSQITVALVDVALQDTAARPLNTFVLYGSYRFPIAFEISYNPMQISVGQQLAIQARIEKDGQLLYINDQYTPVRLPMNFVNVWMKNVQSPGAPSGEICQLRPDPGFCFASFEQFYYNPQLRVCQTFIWGGCAGNLNRFATREECERVCSAYRRRHAFAPLNSKRKWM